MKRLILRLGMSLLLASVLDSQVNAADAPAAGKQVHTVRGIVRSIADDRKTAVIRHEAIPGYMPAMTMELSVRDPKELSENQTGGLDLFPARGRLGHPLDRCPPPD